MPGNLASCPSRSQHWARAIELNGVAIDNNKDAFNWGRVAAHDPDTVQKLVDGEYEDTSNESLDDIIKRRREFLVAYQNENLAQRYDSLVNRTRESETGLLGDDSLTTAVAKSYFKLLSYKDEYEVARLHTETGFLDRVKRDFGTGSRVRFHMAPPLIARKKDARGRPLKIEFGPLDRAGFPDSCEVPRLTRQPSRCFRILSGTQNGARGHRRI